MTSLFINYDVLAEYAGEHLLERTPTPIAIGSGAPIPAYSVAVYVALGLDGVVLYVGSVARPSNPVGTRARIDEHRRHLDRLQQWDQLILFPLRQDTPEDIVRLVEGRIGAHLAPAMSKALPRLWGGRRRD